MFRSFLHIALRNVAKNRRRSSVTVTAIAFGFAALTLFRGYTANVYDELRMSAVVDEGLGHLTLSKKGFRELGSMHPEKYMLTREELSKVLEVAKQDPSIVLATPKLSVSGLVSNGKVSKIFIADGVVPADYNRVLSYGDRDAALRMKTDKAFGTEVGEQLARQLDLKRGSEAVISAATLDGQLNAVNIQIDRAFNTGIPDTNDKYIRMPFSLAQELYDTEGADRVTVLLKSFDDTAPVRERLLASLERAGIAVEIYDWEQLSVFYAGTNDMLGMLLSFMASIVLIIVLMSIINTMGVAVLERTREIGTLRAIGLKRGGAAALFAIEGALLGVIGSAVGLVVHSLVWAVIRLVRPTYMPPGFSEEVPFLVHYVPEFLALMTLAMVIFALLSAILPARRAARQNVVVSLGHV